ncbi:MAG: mycofactocin-associated electron transfer flavoprotein beta subunit [Ilumatobacteraceae bacterium]
MSEISPTTEIVVCLKWVFQVNEPSDARFAGMSPADHAALELALQCAEHIGGEVTAVTVGPLAADTVLREALACGVAHAVRIDAPTATDSADVATMIASTADKASWIWCGDYSTDNGSGSVPSFLAADLQARQALGVINVSFEGEGVSATRRIDGGRREVLDVRAPAVISVEGATARLRRASLAALRTAATAAIDVVTPATPIRTTQHTVHTYRPRARALAAPSASDALDRVRALTMSGATATAQHDVETLAPADAAARIVDALRDWGYL